MRAWVLSSDPFWGVPKLEGIYLSKEAAVRAATLRVLEEHDEEYIFTYTGVPLYLLEARFMNNPIMLTWFEYKLEEYTMRFKGEA